MIDMSKFGADAVLVHTGIDPASSPHVYGGPDDQRFDPDGRVILYGSERLYLFGDAGEVEVTPDEALQWAQSLGAV